VAAESGVNAQPRDVDTVYAGAVHRSRLASATDRHAWGVGMESGVCRLSGRLAVIGWCAVWQGDDELGGAAPPTFFLPRALDDRLGPAVWERGETLSAACAGAFGGSAAAWGRVGVVRLATEGAVDRTELWRTAVTVALATAAWAAPLGVPTSL
jgi:non-canonical (house-cleaning) NTP pyrophosphatase